MHSNRPFDIRRTTFTKRHRSRECAIGSCDAFELPDNRTATRSRVASEQFDNLTRPPHGDARVIKKLDRYLDLPRSIGTTRS